MADTSTAPSDVEWGSFTENGPWNVERGQLAWMRGIKVLRLATRRQVAGPTNPRRVPPRGRLAVVGTRLGGAVGVWALADRRKGGSVSRAGVSRRLREAAEKLG